MLGYMPPVHAGIHTLCPVHAGYTPWADTPLTATAADGMHPTGMLSCYRLQMKCMLGDTGNKRMVRILLECILVESFIFSPYVALL